MTAAFDARDYAARLERIRRTLEGLPLLTFDNDTACLKEGFDLAYREGVFAFHRYEPALHEWLKFLLFSELTPLSGALAFLAVQILAANKIMHANGFAQRDVYFEKRCGIAVNHLRAPVTVVHAVRENGRYYLTGRLSWASGYGIFDTLVAGFHCDGRELQAVVPFTPQPGFRVGDKIETFAAGAMHTVDVELEAFEVAEAQIVADRPLGTYTQNKSISKTVHYALYGLGLGAVEAIRDEESREKAGAALEKLCAAILEATEGDLLDVLRVELFHLVQEIVTTGMILNGSGSLLAGEPLQRYYRELMMFNANGLNNELKQRYKTAFLQKSGLFENDFF